MKTDKIFCGRKRQADPILADSELSSIDSDFSFKRVKPTEDSPLTNFETPIFLEAGFLSVNNLLGSGSWNPILSDSPEGLPAMPFDLGPSMMSMNPPEEEILRAEEIPDFDHLEKRMRIDSKETNSND